MAHSASPNVSWDGEVRLPDSRGLVLLRLLSACSGTSVLNALAPSGAATITHRVVYGEAQRQRLDIYSPAVRGAALVVFLYGGGWHDGDRGLYRFVGAALAAQGLMTVIPDYRVYPEVHYPEFVRDAASVVAWTRTHIADFGGDPGRVFLMGHSAGAHIAALLTLDRRYLAEAGLDPDRAIAGTVGLAGPYDFLPLTSPLYETIFAAAGDLRQTQPITFARADAPPMLLLTGSDDRTVLPRNTQSLATQIHDKGGRVSEKQYPRLGHALILGAIARPLTWLAPVLADVTSFLAANGARITQPAIEAAQAGRSPSASGAI